MQEEQKFFLRVSKQQITLARNTDATHLVIWRVLELHTVISLSQSRRENTTSGLKSTKQSGAIYTVE